MENKATYNVRKLSDGVWVIDEFSMDYLYILEGQNQAVVLDTGAGVWDLKSLVENLVKKPYIVIATHAHMDHVGGIGQFQELRIHSKDIPCFQFPEEMNPVSIYKRKQICERAVAAYGDELPFNPEHLAPVDLSKIELLPFEDGQVFDLGGRSLEVIHVPGHSAGSCCFLDKEDRILFAGDNFGRALILPTGGTDLERIHAWLLNAKKIEARSDEFDLICAGHYCPLERSWFTDMFTCARKALAGQLLPTICEADEITGPMYHWGHAHISIDPQNIFTRDFRRIQNIRRY